MKQILIFLFSVALLVGCRQQTDDQQCLYSDGTLKPVVIVFPLINAAQHPPSWDVSAELTSTIKNHLLQKETIFLDSLSKNRRGDYPAFDSDLSWMKTTFSKKGFAVFIKLTEHKEVSLLSKENKTPEDSPAELHIRLELCIVDIRGPEPKILIEEGIVDTQYLPKQFTSHHFLQIPWGKESYSITPIGLAHAKLAKEIASKIEKQILLSQQN